MDGELRRAAVKALVVLGRGHDLCDRADAGHGLAAFADAQEARGSLPEVVLDQGAGRPHETLAGIEPVLHAA
ncbi:hypothetical protein ACGFZH_21875 [Streptomyces zaomyceticus]|uniref:hypothetical protein n=1 Tax=Streptomyces zaomyceticus TaxID=68286 RepID=UPI003718E5E7